MSNNSIDEKYLDLVKQLIEEGNEKETRNGKTISDFGNMIKHNMKDGFPLLTTKKMAYKSMVVELLWFLRGETNIKYLVDNNCNIWNGDCYKNYVNGVNLMKNKVELFKENSDFKYLSEKEFINNIKTDEIFAKKWGELGPIYGKQWRDWETKINVANIDQIKEVLNTLRNDPDSRRMMVTAWNPSDIGSAVLPPCHFGFMFYTRELSITERTRLLEKHIIPKLDFDLDKLFEEHNIPTRTISLMWSQRSCDVGLGLPFNIASYALLLLIFGKVLNMEPEKLIGSIGDTHLYDNHITPIKEQLDREPFELPQIEFSEWFLNSIEENQPKIVLDEWIYSLKSSDFKLINYKSHDKVILPLSN